MTKGKTIPWILLFVILSGLTSFGVYYNALFNGFIWDDPIVLKNQVSAFRSIKDIFFPPAGIPQFGIHYYRPLVMLTYILDESIWGKENPFGFHLSVILMHVGNTILVFFLIRFLLKNFPYREMGAFIGSLLFGVHPIHTESVAWMAGRSDVMAALFFFLSLFFYLKFKERSRGPWLILSALIFLLASLAKETSLSLILLLPLIDLTLFLERGVREEMGRPERRRKERIEKKRKKKEKVRRTQRRKRIVEWRPAINITNYGPFLIAAFIYLMVRHYALYAGGRKVPQTRNLWEMVRNIINAYGFYIEKVLAPINLKAFIAEVPSGFWSTSFSLAALLFLIGGMVFSFLKKREIISFAIGFFFLTLAPSIMVAVMKISETPLAERYLYIPSFSFSLLFGFLCLSIPIGKGLSLKTRAISRIGILLLVLILFVFFFIQTRKRNTVWKDDILFWEDLVRKVPDQGLPHLNLGLAYSQNKRQEDAEREYMKAINSKYDDEGRSTAFNNLGNIYLARHEYDRAEQCFATAISIRRHYPTPYYSMGLSLWRKYWESLKRGEKPDRQLIEKAIDYLNHAIKLNPQYVKAHALLGEIFFRLHQYDRAKGHLETVLLYEKEGQRTRIAKELLKRISGS